jgi:SAM-dependent methyltransferase
MHDLAASDSAFGCAAARRGRPGGLYTLGSSDAERDRLRQQQAALRGHSSALLDRVGMQAGWSALDLGCGPAGILDLLSARAGPTGRVTGIDVDAGNVMQARAFARERDLGNVRVMSDNARGTALPGGAFDLVHTRLVLVNISQPADVVAEMARLARPGGWVAALEADILGLCYPPHPAVGRLAGLLVSAVRHDGADPHLGRRLPQMLRDAGLTDVGTEARTDVYETGHPQRTVLLDLVRATRSKIVSSGLATEVDLDALDAAARCHLGDARTLHVPVIYFLAWGRKPGTDASHR